MMIKYRVNTMFNNITGIKHFEIARETAKSVIFANGRRERKRSEDHTWHDSNANALNHAISRQKRIIDGLNSELRKATDCLNSMQKR